MTSLIGKRKSYTLIELLFVVLILMILIGISVPHLKKNVARASFSSQVRKVYNFLDLAKTYSLTHKVPIEVFLNAESHILSAKIYGVTNDEIELIFLKELSKKISMKSKSDNIVFIPGLVVDKIQIEISDTDGRTAYVISSGLSLKLCRDLYCEQVY